MIHLDSDAQARLLGRPVRAVLTDDDRRAFAGQRVLVTGAGGSVGSELARQLAACRPALLVLFDHAEYNLFRIDEEIRQLFPHVRVETVLGDVSRAPDIAGACTAARPHVVFHAAAYKHVTLAERAIVPAARTNVIGAVLAARAARAVRSRFVFVSSDKAAQPRGVMGASKRFAELAVLDQATRTFRPSVVRFGNILGSSGSVIEIMLRAVKSGRAVPVTDPDATRFFMTAQEAVSLILKADRLGRSGDVFWLDMGEPLRIGDLAERIIDLATPAGVARVGIEHIGLRPGEKMREELTAQGLEMQPTPHPAIWTARQRDIARDEVRAAFGVLRRACATGDTGRALDALLAAVDDFTPSDAALALARSARPIRTPAITPQRRPEPQPIAALHAVRPLA